MMDILMSETCWAHKKWNKIATNIKLVLYSNLFQDTIIFFLLKYFKATADAKYAYLTFQSLLVTWCANRLNIQQLYALSTLYLRVIIIIIIIIIYLSWSWATSWPVPVSRIQKSLRRSTMIPSASWGVVFHFFFLWHCSPTRAMASSFLRFLDHKQWHITVGRTPLDEWSVRRRDLYPTTHNTHNRQASMPPPWDSVSLLCVIYV